MKKNKAFPKTNLQNALALQRRRRYISASIGEHTAVKLWQH